MFLIFSNEQNKPVRVLKFLSINILITYENIHFNNNSVFLFPSQKLYFVVFGQLFIDNGYFSLTIKLTRKSLWSNLDSKALISRLKTRKLPMVYKRHFFGDIKL